MPTEQEGICCQWAYWFTLLAKLVYALLVNAYGQRYPMYGNVAYQAIFEVMEGKLGKHLDTWGQGREGILKPRWSWN